MRSGHLLAEESPHNLLAIHGLISLEDVFLKLCVKESRGSQNVAVIAERKQQRQVMNDNCGHDNQTFLLEDENSDANSNLKQVNSNSVGTNDCESSTNVSRILIYISTSHFKLLVYWFTIYDYFEFFHRLRI